MLNARRIALMFISIGALGCSCEHDGGHVAVPAAPATPRQPKISLAVEPPVDRMAVKAGAALDIICTVTVESGGFEPMIVTFQISELRKKSMVFSSHTVRADKVADKSFSFRYHTPAPSTPGGFAVDAKVVGIDPTLPATTPPPAPAADGTHLKHGAHGEFSAPTLEIEVKK